MILDPLLALFAAFTARRAALPISKSEPKQEPSFGISELVLERLRVKKEQDQANRQRLFQPAPPPPLAFGSHGSPPERFANDSALATISAFSINNGGIDFGVGSGLFWLGYPYLSELSQRPEYRIIVELFASEMTRKWIILKSTGKEDKTDKIAKLNDAIKKFKLRDAFRNVKRDDGYFGRGQLYVKLKGISENPELLRAPMIVDKRAIPKGSLIGFKKIEPYWTYPLAYNANDPLRDDFFKPTAWTVMGNTVHDSRMLTFIGNPVPDLLKASYSFGGISVIQLMKPYVDAFLRTKNSVNDLISAFSTMVFQTNMSAFLNQTASLTLERRIEAFNLFRDNFGTFVTDKDTEDMKNVSAPIAGLHELQAQAEEHMLIPMRAPLLKAFGLSPGGLNASQEDEIRSFYDNVNSDQEDEYRDPLEVAIKIIQLSEFGEIDEEITFDFEPLWRLDEAGAAAVQKTKSDIDEQNVNMGSIGPEDVRTRIAADPESQYHGLEGPPPDPMEGMQVDADGNIINDPNSTAVARAGERGSETGANSGV